MSNNPYITMDNPIPSFKRQQFVRNTPVGTMLTYSTSGAPPMAPGPSNGTMWSGCTNFGGFVSKDNQAGPQPLVYHTIYDQFIRQTLTDPGVNTAKDAHVNSRFRNQKIY